MVITGILYKILTPTSGIGKKGVWNRQDFIIETKDQYPKKILITIMKDAPLQEFNQLYAGDKIEVSVNIESKEHNNKWYTQIMAWKIAKI